MAAKKATPKKATASNPKFGSPAWNAKYHVHPFTKKSAKKAPSKRKAK